MKIFNQIGSKERLFEMFQNVNKIKINEAQINDENTNNILMKSFDELKNKQLNVLKNTTQIKNNNSYIELNTKDKVGNKIDFTFEITSSEGNNDGVFKIDDVKLVDFKFQSIENNEIIELDENSLNDFNRENKDKMFNIVDEYVDFEISVSDDISEDADYTDEIDNQDIDIEQLSKEKEENGDIIHGGLADDQPLSNFDIDQILKGIDVEMEHTDNPLIALEIACDHLTEDPVYYGEDGQDPEKMAQIGAENDANNGNKDDDELSDVLLGYKPLNIGDEIDENRYFNDELLDVSPYKEISDKLETKYNSDENLKYRHDIKDRIKKLIKINFNWLNKIKERIGLNKVADMLFNYDMKLLNYQPSVTNEGISEDASYNEAYKWKPSASQKREFAQRMSDPEQKAAYEKNKENKAAKKRAGSKFDYSSAGGYYVPTKAQYDFVMNNINLFTTNQEQDAANQIMFGYANNEKIHHDYIHIVNEKIRNFK